MNPNSIALFIDNVVLSSVLWPILRRFSRKVNTFSGKAVGGLPHCNVCSSTNVPDCSEVGRGTTGRYKVREIRIILGNGVRNPRGNGYI